jgi:hypothetical protein
MPEFPRRYALGTSWTSIYNTAEHGFNITTFYRRAADRSPSLLIVKDSRNFVFGCFVNSAWHAEPQYYGTGESFVFSLQPKFEVFHWTRKNSNFICSRADFSMSLVLLRMFFTNIILFQLPLAAGTIHSVLPLLSIASLTSFFFYSGNFALWLDNEFNHGTSRTSSTYDNPCLASGEEFSCVRLEVWAYES